MRIVSQILCVAQGNTGQQPTVRVEQIDIKATLYNQFNAKHDCGDL